MVWNGKLTPALHYKQVPCVDSLSLKEKKKSGKIIAKSTAITTREMQLVMCSFDFPKLQNTKHDLIFNILHNL